MSETWISTTVRHQCNTYCTGQVHAIISAADPKMQRLEDWQTYYEREGILTIMVLHVRRASEAVLGQGSYGFDGHWFGGRPRAHFEPCVVYVRARPGYEPPAPENPAGLATQGLQA